MGNSELQACAKTPVNIQIDWTMKLALSELPNIGTPDQKLETRRVGEETDQVL